MATRRAAMIVATIITSLATLSPRSSVATEYESRYVHGNAFTIGRLEEGVEVWVAAVCPPDPYLIVYVVNGSKRPVTLDTSKISLTRERKGEFKPLRAFSANEWRNRVASSQAVAAALYGVSIGLEAGQAQAPQTTYVSGSYSEQSSSGYAYGSVSGLITTTPTVQERMAIEARAQQKASLVQAQLDASYGAMTANLLESHTLGVGEYFGGKMHFKSARMDTLHVNVGIGTRTLTYRYEWTCR